MQACRQYFAIEASDFSSIPVRTANRLTFTLRRMKRKPSIGSCLSQRFSRTDLPKPNCGSLERRSQKIEISSSILIMPTSSTQRTRAVELAFKGEYMILRLEDGRELAVPLAWYPRLSDATPKQRKTYSWIGKGTGIHWPAIDEDLEVQALVEGRRSVELQRSTSPVGSWFSPSAARSYRSAAPRERVHLARKSK